MIMRFNSEGDRFEDEKEISETERKDDLRDSQFASAYILKPNEQYESNEYSYETDKYSRIERCEGDLRLEEGKRNTAHQIRAGGEYRLETDDGGHLIACRFGGSEKIDNIVPMDAHLNRVEYKEMEDDWAKELEKGNSVEVKIQCTYLGESSRPTDFIIMYKITEPNGSMHFEMRKFHNGKSGGE